MIILALNCGSSSVKYSLYEWYKQRIITKGNIERIGQKGGVRNHHKAIEQILSSLIKENFVDNLNQINAVGHRVVHGGDKFHSSVLIDSKVLKIIKSVSSLAPLHNPPNIDGIEVVKKILPEIPQVAVFDTAFHYTIPEHAYIYPVPYEWYQKYGVRRYGFHGSSHLYVSKVAAKMLKKRIENCNLISLHIGNGVSFTAIKQGISIDTSMGMTPLEGAVMGTRSGSIDPGIIDFMADKLRISAKKIVSTLNTKSGLLGISCKYTDHRNLEQAIKDGDEKAKLSLEIEVHRIKKYIGSYIAIIGRVDALIFTAGVGENDSYIRDHVCDGLEHLGIKLDHDLNDCTTCKSGNTVISKRESKMKIFMIPTNEEAILVEDVVSILQGTYDSHMKYSYAFE